MPLVAVNVTKGQIGEPRWGVYPVVEARRVRYAEGGLVVVARIPAAAPDVSLAEGVGLGLGLPRLVRLPGARRRRCLRRGTRLARFGNVCNVSSEDFYDWLNVGALLVDAK